MGLLDRFRKPHPPEPPLEPVGCVAIILDGNARWAAARGLPVAEGHREGTRALRRTVEAGIELGIGAVVVYGFSTENWTRPPDEVDDLMEIFGETIDRELPDLARQGVRVRFLGRRDRAPEELQDKMAELEAATGTNDRLDLWIAFDYGGRAELADAAKRLIQAGIPPEEIDEDTFARALYEPDLPDPDLLIRTSGEMRVSNFLLWQIAYTELWVTPTRWPDFEARDLFLAVADFQQRNRRFGRV